MLMKELVDVVVLCVVFVESFGCVVGKFYGLGVEFWGWIVLIELCEIYIYDLMCFFGVDDELDCL